MKRVLIILAILLASTGAWAKSLYVSTTGNDSVTYADNSLSQPWLTVDKAIKNAQAGDIVYFRAGSYPIPTVISTASAGNNGTSGSPILFTRYGTEVVTWTSTIADTVIKVGKNHHHFEYLNFVHNPASDTSGEEGFFRSGYEEYSTGFQVKHCTFTMSKRGDNYGSVHLKAGADYVEITHNRITHTSTSGSTNTAGIIAFGVNHFKINNNEIIGPPIGIYLKHANSSVQANVDGEVKNNYAKTSTRYTFFSNFNWVEISNNIFDEVSGSSDGDFKLNEANGSPGGDNNNIHHNLIKGGLYFSSDSGGALNNTLKNNIFVGGKWNNHPYASISDNTTSDYNLYISGDCINRNRVLYTLTEWKAFRPTQDAHSLSGNPTFVGGSSPTTIAGWALATGSLGKGAGEGGADIGPDVTLIGVDPSGGSTCDEPVTSYTEDDTSITEGGTVNFTNTSTGATSYLWSFGDGATSTSTSPSHDYDSAGSFQPYLDATNSCGTVRYYGNLITVTPAQLPTPAITVTASGLDVTVEGTATNGPITSWDWDWGDSTTHGNTQNATHTYATEGGKTITLTVTNAEGQGSVSKSVTLYETTVLPDTPVLESVQIGTQVFGPSVIWHDEFEDSDLETKYWDYNTGSGTPFAQTTDIAFGGSTGSAKGTWTAGQVDAGSCAYHFGRNPVASQTQTDQDFDEIYIRFYMRLSPAWSGQPVKLARVTSFAASSWAQSMADHLWGNAGYLSIDQDPVTGVSGSTLLTTGWNDTSHFTWLGVSRGTATVYDGSYNGRWVCVEHRTKLNTAGSSNGISQTWIDGVLDNSQTNINWIGSWTGYGLNVVRIENYWNQGSAKAQSRYIDNLVISTSPIGLATSPVNPYIYKSNFSTSAEGISQASMTVQVSTSASEDNLVWQGEQSGAGNSCLVNATTGTFDGDLLGRSSLAHSTTYYARVKVTDSADNDSAWSAWVPFKTQAQVSTSKKASGGVSLSGGASM
jgi:PKD repeat protein